MKTEIVETELISNRKQKALLFSAFIIFNNKKFLFN